MNKPLLQMQTFKLLATLLFFSSCNAQENTNPILGSLGKLNNTQIGNPKLIKTQGSTKNDCITNAIKDKHNNLWFGTIGEGVYKYDGKMFTQFTQKDGLISNSVWSLLEDKDGNIWIGTVDGICRFDGEKIISVPISFMVRPTNIKNEFYSEWSTKNTVWSMMQDKTGKIWFGTGDGMYCYNGFNFKRLLANDNIINKDSLTLKMVSDIIEDDKGNIWFASGMPPGYEGFCRYNGKMIESFKPKNEGWFRNVIKQKNGNILLATRHFGVWSYDGKTFTDYYQPNDLVKPSLNCILEDNSGRLWVASDYGVEIGDTLGGLWYSDANNKFTKITNKEVNVIVEDKDSNIWFATIGMELFRYNGKLIEKFTE